MVFESPVKGGIAQGNHELFSEFGGFRMETNDQTNENLFYSKGLFGVAEDVVGDLSRDDLF
jgi:hypothetical protein